MFDNNLLEKAAELGLDIPYSADLSVLSRRVAVKNENITLSNSLSVHPMEGFDSEPNGAPGELTFRRYRRFANSGAGLLWFEATAVQEDARSNARQLWINDASLDTFKRLIDELHERTGGTPVICQLTHSGRFSSPNGSPAPLISYHNPIMNRNLNIPSSHPVVTDDYLERLHEQFIRAARLAQAAGFDGVDIKACHRYLISELLSAYTRENSRYGGSYENRTRLYKDIVRDVRYVLDNSSIVTTRLGVTDAIDYPYGFGVDRENSQLPDLTEPKQLISELNALGVNIINVTMGTPYFNPHVNRPYDKGGYEPPEHPLVGVDRLIRYTGELQKAFPDITLIGTGYSYLRSFAPGVAAGALERGLTSVVGFGRMAFAYEGFARDMMNGDFDAKKCCISCSKCTHLMRAHTTTGCPVRDSELYAPIYRKNCMDK